MLVCYYDGEDTIPLDTEVDKVKRTVSADISADGYYYIMDVAVFLRTLGLDMPTEDSKYVSQMEVVSDEASTEMRTLEMPSMMSLTNDEKKEQAAYAQADIVFVVDTTASMNSAISNVRKYLGEFAEELDASGVSASYALVDYRDITCDGASYTNIKKYGSSSWCSTAEQLKDMLGKLRVDGGGDSPETAIDGLEMARNIGFRDNAQKFIILVTDSDSKNNNNYGIKSMDAMADLLKGDDITVCVVAGTVWACHRSYDVLVEKTNGIYANINSNFKDSLLTIANRIKDNSKGYWIVLDDMIPKVVKLKEMPSNNSEADTDLDGVYDKDEVIISYPLKKIGFNSYLETLYGRGVDFYYQDLYVYQYKSNPVLQDTDSDGMSDKWDSEPRNNKVGMIIYKTQKTDEQFRIRNLY